MSTTSSQRFAVVTALAMAFSAGMHAWATQARAQKIAAPAASLGIARLALVTGKAATYRDPALREIKSAHPDQRMFFYIEPVKARGSYIVGANGTGRLVGNLSIDLELRDKAGQVIKSGDNVLATPLATEVDANVLASVGGDTSKLNFTDVFVNLSLDGLKVADGTYSLRVRLNDTVCSCSAEKIVQFAISKAAS